MKRLPIALLSLLLALGATVGDAPIASAVTPMIVGAGQVRAGMYSSASFLNVQYDYEALNAWTGKDATFAGVFNDVYESDLVGLWDKNTYYKLEHAWAAHSTPIANLAICEQYLHDNYGCTYPTAATIAGGDYDTAIQAWANRVKTWLALGGGRSLFIAPLQEHNGEWVPYGCDPDNFKLAYARIRDIVLNTPGLDGDMVRWVWAPNGWTSDKGACAGHTLGDYYPGSSIVDVIGFSSYRWQNDPLDLAWNVKGSADNMRAVDPDKPYLVLQTAEWDTGNTSDRNQWIRNLFTWAAADENVVGIVWFNVLKETDWRMWNPYPTSQGILTGWKDGMQQTSTIHEWPMTTWFQGGQLPFSPVPTGQLSDRIANTNKYSTAKQVSFETFDPGVPVAYIATGESFPDALAAAAAAGALGGPVLLVRGTDASIPSYVLNELIRLEPQRIVVVGGESAVSPGIALQLETYAPEVVRIGGLNRFHTARLLAEDAFDGPVPIAYVATGRDFPDALAAAAAAGAQGGPVLLTEAGFLPPPTIVALNTLQPAEIVVVGGTAAVSDAVQTQLEALGFDHTVRRVAGVNRYDTAAKLAEFVSDPDVVFVATGLDYPDALAGAAAAGHLGAPLLLTMPFSVPGPTYNKLQSYDPNPSRVIVLGGSAAVSEYVSWQLFLAANS